MDDKDRNEGITDARRMGADVIDVLTGFEQWQGGREHSSVTWGESGDLLAGWARNVGLPLVRDCWQMTVQRCTVQALTST